MEKALFFLAGAAAIACFLLLVLDIESESKPRTPDNIWD